MNSTAQKERDITQIKAFLGFCELLIANSRRPVVQTAKKQAENLTLVSVRMDRAPQGLASPTEAYINQQITRL